MMRPQRICTFIFLASAVVLSAADESPAPATDVEIHGPDVRPGFPDAFALAYKLAENSISPDGKYGVIYANDGLIGDDVMRNFLVALKPFRVLAVVDAYNYRAREEMTVEWTKNSSAAFVEVEGKWGPVGFTLFELRDGRVTRQTNLYSEIERLLKPGLRRAKITSSGARDITFDGSGANQGHESHIDADGQRIHIDVLGTSNPKPMEPPVKTWSGHLEAIWSIPEARWLTQKVTNQTYRQ